MSESTWLITTSGSPILLNTCLMLLSRCSEIFSVSIVCVNNLCDYKQFATHLFRMNRVVIFDEIEDLLHSL